jgi:hypothetical protein
MSCGQGLKAPKRLRRHGDMFEAGVAVTCIGDPLAVVVAEHHEPAGTWTTETPMYVITEMERRNQGEKHESNHSEPCVCKYSSHAPIRCSQRRAAPCLHACPHKSASAFMRMMQKTIQQWYLTCGALTASNVNMVAVHSFSPRQAQPCPNDQHSFNSFVH